MLVSLFVVQTDCAVDKNRTGMQATGVVNEQLTSLSGLDLVMWTSEKYGEPISYTNAQLANKFDLTVDGGSGEIVTNSLFNYVVQSCGSTMCSNQVVQP